MTRFVGNLLDMTRLEAGAMLLDRQPVELGEVVGTALRRVGRALGDSRVVVDLARDLPMLDLDVVLFEQVLVNLLDNAAKYAPPGLDRRDRGTLARGRDHLGGGRRRPGDRRRPTCRISSRSSIVRRRATGGGPERVSVLRSAGASFRRSGARSRRPIAGLSRARSSRSRFR